MGPEVILTMPLVTIANNERGPHAPTQHPAAPAPPAPLVIPLHGLERRGSAPRWPAEPGRDPQDPEPPFLHAVSAAGNRGRATVTAG